MKFKKVFTGDYTGTCQNMKKVFVYKTEDDRFVISHGSTNCHSAWKYLDTKTGLAGNRCKFLKDAKSAVLERFYEI
jgi:hypothetical protein